MANLAKALADIHATNEAKKTNLLRPKDIYQGKMNCSRAFLWKLANTDPSFPKKITLSSRCVGWLESDIDAYLASKAGV